MQQQQQSNQNQNWMPLESNPQVINQFIQKMGLKTQLYSFTEMLSTQQWALQMIPKPVVGILFLYEDTPVQSQYKKTQGLCLKPQEIPSDIFFMRQYARNACGTIALFHLVLNAAKAYPEIITPGSYLDNFRANSSNIDPSARGELFKNSKNILEEHKQAVSEGQSNVQSECDSHFVAIIFFEGKVYELDGILPAPIPIGLCTQQQFLNFGSSWIKQYMERDPDNLTFSMIVLSATAQE